MNTPRSIKAALAAYLTAYSIYVGPSLFMQIAKSIYRRKPLKAQNVLLKEAEPRRFPAFCAYLVLLILSFDSALKGAVKNKTTRSRFSAFMGAYAATNLFSYLNRHNRRALSLLSSVTTVRSLDAILMKNVIGGSKSAASNYYSLIFILSCWRIMYCWFYHPEKLPRYYNQWISRMADADPRLLEALKSLHFGSLKYGSEAGSSKDLQDYAESLGLPRDAGNPAKVVPIPCSLIHHNISPSCEIHSLYRCYKLFVSAMSIYLPLHVFLRLRRKGPSALKYALIDATRSSSFLAVFTASIWYTVCVCRTHVTKALKLPPGYTDVTLGPLIGSLVCGFSVFLEKPSRRSDLALFVAPFALRSFIPSSPKLDAMQSSLGFSYMITAARENPESVRLGKLINRLFGSI
ncbi:hypothetical protein CANCADRAFT_95364 [Tortispora caseinolytica NRRL Y-17796]|uniref:Transmembrane protein 135 N-terminal domain-containing protein n=1 Tax=Tortispora caseinolytica NRRL Y-17796 TaxID=767744 RepID=A0A1E4TMD9_9ASCO|nr:hypothetical protein CANCADRAFT_95364 [Tortispora caseinolytica NRRL Y-17796]